MYEGVLREAAGAGIMSAGYAASFAIAELVRGCRKWDGELSRKTSHVLGGIWSLLLPLLVHEQATILALGISGFLFLLFTQRLGTLKAVHGTNRRSIGAPLFPLAVMTAALVSREQPFAYASAILVLAFADTAAALVGRRFGRHQLRLMGGTKSFEGYLAFFITAFLCVSVAATVNGIAPEQFLPAAFCAAFGAAAVELFSPLGSDNLLIPLSVLLLIGASAMLPEVLAICFPTVALCLSAAFLPWKLLTHEGDA